MEKSGKSHFVLCDFAGMPYRNPALALFKYPGTNNDLLTILQYAFRTQINSTIVASGHGQVNKVNKIRIYNFNLSTIYLSYIRR